MFLKCKDKVKFTLLILLLFLYCGCTQKNTATHDTRYIDSVVTIARIIGDSIDGNARLRFLENALKNRELTPDEKFRLYTVKHYTNLLKFYDYKTALVYADSMLWIADNFDVDNVGDKKFTAHKQRAEALYGLEQYKQAYEAYEIAGHIADTVRSTAVKSKFLYSLGMAYYKEEKYLEAAHLFWSSFLLASKADDKEIMNMHYYRQQLISNTGLAYSIAGSTDSAMYFFRKAVSYIQTENKSPSPGLGAWDEALSVVYGNMATLYRNTGETDSAAHYFARSIQISRATGRNLQDRQYNELKLADLLITQERYDSALTLLKDVVTSDSLNKTRRSLDDSLELKCRITEVFSKYYSAVGNYERAFVYLDEYHKSVEQKSGLVQKIKVNNLENGIGAVGHEKQILTLEKDKKIRNQRMTILVLFIGLSVFGLVIIYYYMRLHKLTSQKLKEENEQILNFSTQVEQSLKKKIDMDKANYLALLENTDDCLWSMDTDLNILAFNKVYRDFVEVITGKIPRVGQSDPLKEVNADFYENIMDGYKAALAGETYNSIDKGIYTGGLNYDFAMRFNPIRDKNGEITGIACTRKDITEYFDLTDSLKKNTEQFKNIAWLQSHALRGPLTTIMGIADLLSDQEHKLDQATTLELINGMNEKLEELDRLVNEIVKLTY